MVRHIGIPLHSRTKKKIKYFGSGINCLDVHRLTGFHLFDSGATFLEKDTVSAIGAPYIDVDLNFLLAPCTFVGTCHI